jgi:hypothetical protein
LVQDAVRECDISGPPPTTVLTQPKEIDRVVNWVADAYTELQSLRQNWRWLRSRFTLNTAPNDDTYAGTDCTDSRTGTPITRFSRWWMRNELDEPGITRYLASAGVAGEVWLVPLEWSTFRRIYRRGVQTLARSNPVHVTVDPQNNLCLGPNPNDIYTIQGEYQMSAQVLAANADVPEMPAQFHRLIVYKAMLKYAFFESAPEVKQRAEGEARTMLSDLEENQLPGVLLGRALA